KCAILCLALGPDRAAEILGLLSSDELVTVTREIAGMPKVEAEVVDVVLNEYESSNSKPERGIEGGLPAAEKFLARALGDDKAKHLLGRIQSDVAGARLARLERVEPRLFASILVDEHPQSIAVILAHLEPKQASKALEE